MDIKINFLKALRAKYEIAVITVYKGKKPGEGTKALDKKTRDFAEQALTKNKKFTAKLGETLVLSTPEDCSYDQIVWLGLGDPAELDVIKCETAGGKLSVALGQLGAEAAVMLAAKDKGLKKTTPDEAAAHIAYGFRLRSYSFTQYKSKQDKTRKIKKLDVVAADLPKAAGEYKTLEQVGEGVFLARDLVNEPPNQLYPETMAKRIKDELTPLGVSVEILDEKKMQKLGMGALLAVGMGSDRPPRMAIMRWNGSGKKPSKTVPLAFVGKGVTFDTGGVSLKPAASMQDMKMDMGGAAAVIGLIKALALRKSKADVIGAVGLVENMPSARSYRPDDILVSLSGKTIEVHNTDAEGRLVLADTLTYVQQTYKPKTIIDLATLTGAMMVALGHEYCGSFVNDDKLWSQMEQSSAATGEKLWRMPLDEAWRSAMESAVADLQNLGKTGRFAGACTAAGFLEHFIEDGVKWSHMDIAGTAWRKSDQPTVPKFGTGFGVRVLNRLVADHYES